LRTASAPKCTAGPTRVVAYAYRFRFRQAAKPRRRQDFVRPSRASDRTPDRRCATRRIHTLYMALPINLRSDGFRRAARSRNRLACPTRPIQSPRQPAPLFLAGVNRSPSVLRVDDTFLPHRVTAAQQFGDTGLSNGGLVLRLGHMLLAGAPPRTPIRARLLRTRQK